MARGQGEGIGRWDNASNMKTTKISKYRNRPVWECEDCQLVCDVRQMEICEGCGSGQVIRHASRREFNRYYKLLMLEKAGQIRNLRRQVPFTFEIQKGIPGSIVFIYLMAGKRKLTYVADFVYEEAKHHRDKLAHPDWVEIIEDCKGARTSVYKIKKELMRVINGIEIRET